MLEKVELHHFKNHQSTQINLDDSRLHGLVGQNSSGKTSVLQALHYLSQLTELSLQNIFDYQKSPDFIVTVGQREMSVICNGFWGYENRENWEFSYEFTKAPNNNDWTHTIRFSSGEHVGQTIAIGRSTSLPMHEKLYPESSKELYPIYQSLKHVVHLNPTATNLAKAAYSEAITPRVEFDGSGLAPTLDYLRDEAPDNFQLIQEMLRRIVPSVQSIGIRRAKVSNNRQRVIDIDGKSISYEEHKDVMGQEILFNMKTGERIPAHAISEGTILTLGLLTVLMNPEQPNLILLDDVEQGLHPKAQRELITVLKEIIQVNKNIQIIFSTHSPYVVDELIPSQIHVLSNRKNTGFVLSKRLDEHPDIEWAKQTLTTGEFWSAEGEEWVLQGDING